MSNVQLAMLGMHIIIPVHETNISFFARDFVSPFFFYVPMDGVGYLSVP